MHRAAWYYRLACALGLHRWAYERNDHGGRPMRRACLRCPCRERWNFDRAREHGAIWWERDAD